MSDILLTAIAGLITTFGGAFGGWFFTRKKNNAEAEISELQGVEKAIGIWRETAEKLTEEVKKLREENQNLYFEICKLRSVNNRILKALSNITPDNAKQMVDEIKQVMNENHE